MTTPSKIEREILATLVPGGMLTTEQLARAAGMSGLRIRFVIAELKHCGAIVAAGYRSSRWEITSLGRSLVEAAAS